jgi:hypothetical protein
MDMRKSKHAQASIIKLQLTSFSKVPSLLSNVKTNNV